MDNAQTPIKVEFPNTFQTDDYKIVISSSARKSLNTVVRVAVPRTLLMPDFPSVRFADGTEMPMSFLKTVGDITRIYTIQGEFPPGPTEIEGWIVEGSKEQHESLSFVFSPWVASDLVSNVPKLVITLSNGVQIVHDSGGSIELDSVNKHCATFDFKSEVRQGFYLRQFLTVNSNLDHIQFKLGLNWHDRYDRAVAKDINSIKMVCKNEFVIHFYNQMSILAPSYNSMTDEWSVELTGPHALRDGAGFEIRGYILSMPENLMPGDVYYLPDTQKRIENLNAVRDGFNSLGVVGEVNAVHANLNYNGNWFNNHLPKQDPRWSTNLRNPLITSPGIYGTRAVGSAKTPGQTGSQQDFGADKGFLATVCLKPNWITHMRAGQVDRLRTFNVVEPTGARVAKENHPGWKTWNMETFDALSTDTLGKEKTFRPPGTGWLGYDNQHRSQNGVMTYYALTGDELTYDTLLNCLEADIAQAPYGQADREVGRMFSCWAKMLRVLDADQIPRLLDHVKYKLDALFAQWRGRFPSIQGDPNRTVRVNQIIIDPRSAILNPATGRLEPCWIAYQCAQMCAGLYEFYLRYQDPRLMPMIKDLARSFLWHGCFKEDGKWIPALFVRYITGLDSGAMVPNNESSIDEGLPLPRTSYRTGNWEISLDVSPQGWWPWVGPCVAIANLVLEDEASKERAKDIMDSVFPTGFTSIETAEWFGLPIR